MPDNRAPLRLQYEPGEYLCTWAVPNGDAGILELPGNLTVLADRPPRGEVYGAVPLRWDEAATGVRSAGFPQQHSVPVLHGILSNGGTVLVTDATVIYWTGGVGHIRGAAALVGSPRFLGFARPDLSEIARTEVLVTEVEVQVGALDAAMGTAPISSVRNPTISEKNPPNEWVAVLNAEMRLQWNRDGVTLDVGYDGRMRAVDGFEFKLAWSPKATFAFQNPIPVADAIRQFVQPLRSVLSVATGSPEQITYLAAKPDGESDFRQIFGSGCKQAPYQSTTAGVRDANCSVRAKGDELSLLDMTLEWGRLTNEHHPLTETYGAMLHARDQHPRSRYLLLVQALEGMHGRDTQAEFEQRVESHAAKYEAVLEAAKEHLGTDQLKFIKNALRKTPATTLETALKSMVTLLPTDVMPRLDASALVVEVMNDPRVPASTLSALRVARNNLAHGIRGYDGSLLLPVVEILEQVVRAHALRLLGCQDEVLVRVLRESG